jgi:hypothetical protein
VKLKLFVLLNSIEALTRLSGEKLPLKTAYWIQKNLSAVKREHEEYETVRSKLVMELGEHGNDDSWKVKVDNMEYFGKQLAELLSEETECDVKKVTLPDELMLTPADVSALEWMILGLD